MSDSDSYRACVCTRLEGPGALEIQHMSRRPLGPKEVRIAVRAAGVNFPDLLLTQGAYQLKLDPPFTPGMEIAGVVLETGSAVGGFAVGDKVMAGLRSGGFAEEAVVAEGAQLTPLPATFTFEEGAAFYVAARTAYHALIERGALKAGEVALILGATGGVGLAAVQIAKRLGATAIAVGSSDAKLAVARRLGATHTVNHAGGEMVATVRALAPDGVDVVYDPVGGSLAREATRLLGWGGRFLIVGFASGEVPSFPANHALIKGYSIIGLRAGEAARRDPASLQACLRDLSAWAEQGQLTPHISNRFPLERASAALQTLAERGALGRLVITMRERDA